MIIYSYDTTCPTGSFNRPKRRVRDSPRQRLRAENANGRKLCLKVSISEQSSRKELATDIEALKKKTTGTE
ncbi:hypothetical protein E2542_SST27341 [Spatholobus suberectus]|nr:hypothetical protein E2542_SST27341 [Spatholobus suberectus]